MVRVVLRPIAWPDSSAELELRAALLQLDHCAVEVMALLASVGIPSILLKGPSFAGWLYEDRRDRLYTDVDVLVPSGRLKEARETLVSNGYRFDSDHPLGVHLTFYRHGSNARVEVHTTLLGLGVDPSVVWPILSEHAEPFWLIGKEVRGFNDVGRALHVLLHAASDATGHPLDDLERALERVESGRWADVLDLADRLNARDAFVQGLSMAVRGELVLQSLGIPREVSPSVRLRVRKASNATQVLAVLTEARGLKQRWEIVRRAVSPSPELMRQRYPLARRGPVGLVAMYLVRLVVTPIKTVAAVPSWWSAHRRQGPGSPRP